MRMSIIFLEKYKPHFRSVFESREVHILKKLFNGHIFVDFDSKIDEKWEFFRPLYKFMPTPWQIWDFNNDERRKICLEKLLSNAIILTIMRLFHREKFFIRIQDPLPMWSCTSLHQLPIFFKLYSFVFIGEKLQLIDLLRMKIQFFFGHKSDRFVNNLSLPSYFSDWLLGIFRYKFLIQL